VILSLVTDRRQLCLPSADAASVRACLLAQARYAVEARIDLLQVRERDLDARALAALVSELVAMTRGTRTRVVVNDRIDVALCSGADGVHLRGDSAPAAAVRGLVPRGFIVGRSVHDAAEAAEPGREVDYLIAGAVWASRSKPAGQRLLGIDGLAAVVAAARVPVLAIGGLTVDRISDAAVAGAAGIAAIGLFMGSTSGTSACRAVQLDAVAESARAKFGITAYDGNGGNPGGTPTPVQRPT
jgi:thiamine-phosphate pyrophosphorylase